MRFLAYLVCFAAVLAAHERAYLAKEKDGVWYNKIAEEAGHAARALLRGWGEFRG